MMTAWAGVGRRAGARRGGGRRGDRVCLRHGERSASGLGCGYRDFASGTRHGILFRWGARMRWRDNYAFHSMWSWPWRKNCRQAGNWRQVRHFAAIWRKCGALANEAQRGKVAKWLLAYALHAARSSLRRAVIRALLSNTTMERFGRSMWWSAWRCVAGAGIFTGVGGARRRNGQAEPAAFVAGRLPPGLISLPLWFLTGWLGLRRVVVLEEVEGLPAALQAAEGRRREDRQAHGEGWGGFRCGQRLMRLHCSDAEGPEPVESGRQ